MTRPSLLEILQPDGTWWLQSTYASEESAGAEMVDLENLWADDFPDIRMRVIHRAALRTAAQASK